MNKTVSLLSHDIDISLDILPPSLIALESYKQFIGYVLTPRTDNLGKMDKIPFNYNTRHRYSALEPQNWMDAATAISVSKLFGYGVGFVLTKEDPFACIDIDNCLTVPYDISTATPIALELMSLFQGAAIEISSSGKGLHLFFSYRGSAPLHNCRNSELNLELYTEKRFIALTGTKASGDAGIDFTEAFHKLIQRHFLKLSTAEPDSGSIDQQWEKQVAIGTHPDWCGDGNDEQLIQRMLNSKPSAQAVFGNKASFKDLWEGNIEAMIKAFPDDRHECGYDESKADMALACQLAFWTGKNAERIMRLMQQSVLKRGKWDRYNYLKRTILKAVSEQKKVYASTNMVLLSHQNSNISDFHSSSSKFEIISAANFASTKSLPWIIKGVLPKAELAMVFGPSGSGKSFLVLDLAFAIARGIAWCGHKVGQGKVVYIVAEGAGGFRKRLTAYKQHHACELELVSLDIIPATPNFLGQNDLSELSKGIEQASVIILDTLACIAAGGDENSSTDMGVVLTNCKLLHNSTGALVILVHHMGKDTSRGARGWSGIRAAVDSEIEVTSSKDGFKVRITKLKDGEDGKTFNFRLISVDLGVDEDGDPITSCVIEYIDSHVMPQRAKGKNEKLIIETIESLSQDGQISIQTLINNTISKMPTSQGKRDQRKAIVKKALHGLEGKGYLKIHNGTIFISPNVLNETVL